MPNRPAWPTETCPVLARMSQLLARIMARMPDTARCRKYDPTSFGNRRRNAHRTPRGRVVFHRMEDPIVYSLRVPARPVGLMIRTTMMRKKEIPSAHPEPSGTSVPTNDSFSLSLNPTMGWVYMMVLTREPETAARAHATPNASIYVF